MHVCGNRFLKGLNICPINTLVYIILVVYFHVTVQGLNVIYDGVSRTRYTHGGRKGPVCKWGYNSHSRGTAIIPFTLTLLWCIYIYMYTLAKCTKEKERSGKRETRKKKKINKERRKISFSFSRLSGPIKRTPRGVGNRRDELLRFLHK